MKRLLAKETEKVKMDMKTRYLAGESVPSIARSYETSDRNTYYHLEPLTHEEKVLHVKNADLRRMAIKKQKEGHDSTESAQGTT